MAQKTSGIILLYLLRITLCIPLSEFYTFGGNAVESNQRLGDGNSATSGEITTNQLYYFYGQRQFTITVSYSCMYPYVYINKYILNLKRK